MRVKKRRSITVRMTVEEFKQLRRIARRIRGSESDAVRALIAHGVTRETLAEHFAVETDHRANLSQRVAA